ncbi:MAG TPA: hypothetical protein VFW73_04415 [Lacipirellulaceae bacterium]|nr:hypothetical protein [Lacipirellulaceae bacterium]
MIRIVHLALFAISAILATPCRVGGAEPADLEVERRPPSDRNVIVEADFESDRDPILVPVKVRNKIYKFMLDSGAPEVTYDRSLREYLGASRGTERRARLFGSDVVELCEPSDVYLGRLNIRPKSLVACSDLSNLRRHGVDAYGVIGMNVLQRYVLQLNPDRRQVLLMKSAPASKSAGIPTQRAGVYQAVTADIERFDDVSFIIDTGCTGAADACMPADLFAEFEEDGLFRRIYPGRGFSWPGEGRSRLGVLNEFWLGKWRHAEILLASHQSRSGRYLGLRFWSRYIATFDFPNYMIYLKPSRQYDERADDNPAGFTMRRGWGQTIINALELDGMGQLAGLRVGDIIRFVDTIDASKASLFELRSALRARGKTICLKCEREGKPFVTQLRVPDDDVRRSQELPPTGTAR